MQRGIWILEKGGFYGIQIELCYGFLQGSGALGRGRQFRRLVKRRSCLPKYATPNEKQAEKGARIASCSA